MERLEQEEEKKENENAEEIKIGEGGAVEKIDTRFKNKFIKIWKLNEQLQREEQESEQFIGPRHFKALMKLG